MTTWVTVSQASDILGMSERSVRRHVAEGKLESRMDGNRRMVKVDVEGAEWSVVSGMEPILADGRDDLEVIVEIDAELLAHQGRRTDDILALFADHGFHAYRLRNDYSPESYIARHRAVPPERLREPLGGVSDLVFSRRDADHL